MGIDDTELETYYMDVLNECLKLLERPAIWEIVELTVNTIKKMLIQKDFPATLIISHKILKKLFDPYFDTKMRTSQELYNIYIKVLEFKPELMI